MDNSSNFSPAKLFHFMAVFKVTLKEIMFMNIVDKILTDIQMNQLIHVTLTKINIKNHEIMITK